MTMNGYCNLQESSPRAVVTGAGKGRRSLELTNTKETKAWEGLAIGAMTLARTFSTGSQRFRRSGSQRSCRGGLPGALRRAFSMRRPPAGPGVGDGYWRIHDMDADNDSDRAGGDATLEEAEAEVEEEAENKQREEEEDGTRGDNGAAAVKEETDDANVVIRRTTTTTKKKRGGFFKACKKLLLGRL